MILDLANVKKYQSIIGSVSQVGNPVFGSIYLDFTKQVINFSNSDVFGEIAISVELHPGEQTPENIFVPANKLLHVLKKSPKIIMAADYSMKVGQDEVKLQHFSDVTYEFPEFDEDSAEEIELKNASSVARYMKRAMHYIDANPDSPQCGVFFKENSILATDSISFYEWKSTEELPDLSLSVEMTRIFLSLPLSEENATVTFKQNETAIQVVYEEFLLQMGQSMVLEIIDPTSTEFQELFDFEHYVSCDYEEIIREVEFLEAFFQDAPDERMKLEFAEDSVVLSVEDDNQASSTVAISEVSDAQYFNGQNVWLSGSSLLQALKDLPGTNVRFAFDLELPPVDIMTTDDAHVLVSRFEEGS